MFLKIMPKKIYKMDNRNLNNADPSPLLISESNYSCQLYDESFIKNKNDKTKQIYQLEEKEREIYEEQE